MVTSCGQKDLLDVTVTSDLTEETVFSDSARTIAFLSDIYNNIGFSTSPTRFNNGGLDAACDEAEPYPSNVVRTTSLFAQGTVNASSVSDDAWSVCYTNIRRVNKFLMKIDANPMQDYLKPTLKAEARFLRAWYYFILVQHYGGIPLVGDDIYTQDDKINIVRNTFEDCVNYILAECDKSALVLTNTREQGQYGRISRGACLALKSRVLLYAASPLYNPATPEQTLFSDAGAFKANLIRYATYDKERWHLAALAAKEVMDLGAFSLVDTVKQLSTFVGKDSIYGSVNGFYSVFQDRVNTEYILARMQGDNAELEHAWLPPTRKDPGSNDGKNGGFPYQEFVDAFEMANGKAINDPTSGYKANDPYKNRDPRLNFSIIHDSTLHKLRQASQIFPVPITIYLDAVTLIPKSTKDAFSKGTPTGYYVYKMVNKEKAGDWFEDATKRCFPLMRYAEILLNYAEALNEWNGGPNKEVYDAVELIRKRAGINPYALKAGLNQEEMRTIIHHERRIELSYEGHRFFDVRRWLEAFGTQDQQMHGMKVLRTATTVNYEILEVSYPHKFRKCMYYWPIPEKEVGKSVGDNKLVQNPEW